MRVRGEKVIKVKAEKRQAFTKEWKYYQGEPISPGEFTYQWCFDSPVIGNSLCSVENYKSGTSGNYKPKTLNEQELKIIRHGFLEAREVFLAAISVEEKRIAALE